MIISNLKTIIPYLTYSIPSHPFPSSMEIIFTFNDMFKSLNETASTILENDLHDKTSTVFFHKMNLLGKTRLYALNSWNIAATWEPF